jgi:hypothetical protein
MRPRDPQCPQHVAAIPRSRRRSHTRARTNAGLASRARRALLIANSATRRSASHAPRCSERPGLESRVSARATDDAPGRSCRRLLDRYGHAIAARGATSSRVIPGSGGVSSVRTYLPGSSSPAPCSITRVRLVGVTAQWEVVATTTPALGSVVVPTTLFSCARSWFSIKGQSQAPSAAVLLDAQDPRRPAPPLPGLMSTGQPGVFSEPSAEILAKRVGLGWLVVQSQSASVGRMLLGAIRVGGSAIRRNAHEPPPAQR